MKMLSVRDLRSKSAQLWEDLSAEGEMLVTNNGRPVAILVSVGEGNFEQSFAAIRRARAVEAVARLQQQSAARGKDRMSAEEIEAEIKAARRSRKR